MTTDLAAAVAAETSRQADEDDRPLPPLPSRGPAQDGIETLLLQARRNPSKRIQTAAIRAQDAVQKVRDLIAADAGKAALRERAERLERELRAVKAELRGKPASGNVAAFDPKAVRAWAEANNVVCPERGRVPQSVVAAYTAAQA